MPTAAQILAFLRTRPAAVFWLATLAQAVLWVLLPALFYASPPGHLAEVLAIGREWQPGSWLGPPLSFWLADLAFRAAGGHVIGVYVLSQLCVVAAFWAIFQLGRSIVGDTGAALAILLMTSVFALSMPTPEFGPDVLAMPLAALALLLYWRALGENRGTRYWVALAFCLGLLLFASYWGLVLLCLLAAFTVATPQGRAALRSIDPWAAFAIALLVPFPHAAWLYRGGFALLPPVAPSPLLWLLFAAGLALSHVGLVALVAIARGVGAPPRDESEAVAIDCETPTPSGRRFVVFFALAPAIVGSVVAAASGQPSFGWAGPLVLLSGLVVIVLVGCPVWLRRVLAPAVAWIAALALPAFAILAAILVLPWVTIEPPGQEPAGEIGRFFAETFQRRVGRPLEIVSGDVHVASLIAATAPGRPRVYAATTSERTPWLDAAEARRRGTVVVWPIEDAVGAPPAAIRARFPDLVPEVPQTFARRVQGFLPSIRIGWALVRPAAP